jgi:hypothetical protein
MYLCTPWRCGGEGRIAPFIPNGGTRWRWGQRSSRFIPEGRCPICYRIRDWLGLRAGIGLSPQPEIGHDSLGVQPIDRSLLRLSHRPQIQIHLLEYRGAFYILRGSRWRSLLRNCAESRKIAGSIPGGIIGIINWFNTSGLWADSASKGNEYQGCLLVVKTAGA